MSRGAPRRRGLLRPVAVAALIALAGAALAGCGKKGPPELPEGQSDQYPKQYPSPDES